jgi:hypothetical protein
MDVMRHAALHVQAQHIIWQQVLINIKDTSGATPLSKGMTPQKLDASHPKK